jgi:hypothetical protein
MRSIFYNQVKGRRFPVSLIALEYYVAETQFCDTEEAMFDVFLETLVRFCGVTAPDDEDVEYFLSRLEGIRSEIQPGTTTKGRPNKSFGTSYDQYIQDLTLDSTILRMVGYNLDAAKRIYHDLDRDDAMKLVSEYVTGLREEGLLQLEASMYGFGGKYKNDKGQTKAKVHDLTTEEGRAALKRCGF